MAEIVISPSGPAAMETGLMIDEAGDRFVVLTFREPDADPVLVTFTVPLFQNFVHHLGKTAEAALDEFNWQVPE